MLVKVDSLAFSQLRVLLMKPAGRSNIACSTLPNPYMLSESKQIDLCCPDFKSFFFIMNRKFLFNLLI